MSNVPALRLTFVFALARALVFTARSQAAGPQTATLMPSSIAVDVTPLFTYPMGQSADLFTMSGAARLGFEWSLAGTVQPFFSGAVQYAFVPVQAQTSLSVLSAEAGAGLCFWVAPRFGIRASLAVGGWMGAANEGGAPSTHVMGSASLGLRYLFLPSLDIGLQAGYR
jgi:hypothetical protein